MFGVFWILFTPDMVLYLFLNQYSLLTWFLFHSSTYFFWNEDRNIGLVHLFFPNICMHLSNSLQKFLHGFGEEGAEGRLGLESSSQGTGRDCCDFCTGNYFWTFWAASEHDHITVCVVDRDREVCFFWILTSAQKNALVLHNCHCSFACFS